MWKRASATRCKCSEEALRAESGCAEALVLATCNRVEVYVSADRACHHGADRALSACGAAADAIEDAERVLSP